jgi:hypothetical protein
VPTRRILQLTTWGDDTITRSGRIEPHDAPGNRAAHPTEINPGHPDSLIGRQLSPATLW